MLAPVVPLVWFLSAWCREVRRDDELNRGIRLDPLAFALPAFLFIIIGSELLPQVEWPTPPAAHP